MTVRNWRTIDGVAGGTTGRRGEGDARRSDDPTTPRDSHIRTLDEVSGAARDASDSLNTPRKSSRGRSARPAETPPAAAAPAREVLAESAENPAPSRPEPAADVLDDDGADAFDAAELRALSGYAKLAELLKDAHRGLRDMDLDVPDRADFVRRLLVITAAARHDQGDAMRRLELFLQSVDGRRRPSL
jgi:hypothetical protein